MLGRDEKPKREVRPEVQRAVVELLRAEQQFLRAWGDWKVHPRDAPTKRRVDDAELHLEEAQAAAIEWHARAHDEA
jgi:hypothetical protein